MEMLFFQLLRVGRQATGQSKNQKNDRLDDVVHGNHLQIRFKKETLEYTLLMNVPGYLRCSYDGTSAVITQHFAIKSVGLDGFQKVGSGPFKDGSLQRLKSPRFV
jgi:hypothetical protein